MSNELGAGPAGGIPVGTTVCSALSPSGGDDGAPIQAAIDACPVGQVVQLTAGTFRLAAGKIVVIVTKIRR